MMSTDYEGSEIPNRTIREVRSLIHDNQPVVAIDKLMKETNMTLLEATTFVEKQTLQLSETVPESIEKKARLFLHRGQAEQAVQFVSEQTDLNDGEVVEYIEDLQPSINIQIPAEVEQEIANIFIGGDKMEAVHRVRGLNSVGLHDAVDYLNLVAQDKNPTIKLDTTLPTSDEQGTATLVMPAVNQKIKELYDRSDWEGVAAIISFYGKDKGEMGQERVHLAILELADGDVQKLPGLVVSAKQDYRDILFVHSKTTDTMKKSEKGRWQFWK